MNMNRSLALLSATVLLAGSIGTAHAGPPAARPPASPTRGDLLTWSYAASLNPGLSEPRLGD
jgi:hypothetical protein